MQPLAVANIFVIRTSSSPPAYFFNCIILPYIFLSPPSDSSPQQKFSFSSFRLIGMSFFKQSFTVAPRNCEPSHSQSCDAHVGINLYEMAGDLLTCVVVNI